MNYLLPIFLVFVCLASCAQSTANSSPLDPSALAPDAALSLLQQKNGLDMQGNNPWYLKVSFELLDEHQKVSHSGTLEEWWIGPQKNRQSWIVDGVSSVVFQTESGEYIIGQAIPSYLRLFLPALIAQPVEIGSPAKLEGKRLHLGSLDLSCLHKPVPGRSTGFEDGSGLCFTDRPASVRLLTTHDLQIAYNNLVSFRGRYIARDVEVYARLFGIGMIDANNRLETSVQAVKFFSSHLEEITAFQSDDPSFFAIPAAAVRLEHTVKPFDGAEPPVLLDSKKVRYPDGAKATRIQGWVLLCITIGNDGRVIAAEPVVSAASILTNECVQAVRSAKYKPAKLAGKAVAYRFLVLNNFALGTP